MAKTIHFMLETALLWVTVSHGWSSPQPLVVAAAGDTLYAFSLEQ